MSAPALAQYSGRFGCTGDCSGHEAGYEWAVEQGITDPKQQAEHIRSMGQFTAPGETMTILPNGDILPQVLLKQLRIGQFIEKRQATKIKQVLLKSSKQVSKSSTYSVLLRKGVKLVSSVVRVLVKLLT